MDPEILKAALAPGAECLPVEELGRYVDGTLPPAEHAAAAAHIRSCINCRAELTLLQAITSNPIRPDEGDVVRNGVGQLERHAVVARNVRTIESTGRWWLPSTPRLAALVAIVLLTLVAGRLYEADTAAPLLPSAVRTDDEVARSQTVAVRTPLGDLRDAPQRLEWRAVNRAVRYQARLFEVDRREVWSVSTAGTAIELPPAVRALSVPLKTLLWEVTAYDTSGTAIASSGAQAFRVVRQ
jgi:hypothetical protein